MLKRSRDQVHRVKHVRPAVHFLTSLARSFLKFSKRYGKQFNAFLHSRGHFGRSPNAAGMPGDGSACPRQAEGKN